MEDARVEILNSEYSKWVSEKDLGAIYPSNFPAAYTRAAINAMDEYMKECAISFLKYVLEKMQGHSVDAAGNVEVKYNGEWVTPETLFENFL